jgi:hypothetical protein
MERVMGIEQIEPTKSRALLPVSQSNWRLSQIMVAKLQMFGF